jgi:hypothetical protein
MMTNKPTVPEVIERFTAYHVEHPAWGTLHCVLDDGNYGDGSVQYAIRWALEEGDVEGEALARILLRMSKTQRSKIARLAFDPLHP